MDWQTYTDWKAGLDEVPWTAVEREQAVRAWLDQHEEADGETVA